MRIVILTPSYFPFYMGAERIIHDLSIGLTQRGHKVFLLCPKNCSPVGDEERVEVMPILLEGWNRNLFINSLIVLKVLSSIRANLLHIHFAYPFGLIGVVCKLLLGLPYIVTSHGWDIQIDQKSRYGARLNPRFALQIWLSLKLANAHTIVGKQMLPDAVKSGAPPSNVFLIPPGISIPKKMSKTIELQSPCVTKDEIMILFVGRLVKKKGVKDLVKASSSVLREVPKAKFVIVGDGDQRESLIEYAKELGVMGDVLFLGQIPEEEKGRLLQRADIFVYPSYKEGLSLVLLEAMAYGKALVLSRIPSFMEVLGERDALYFDPGDTNQMAKAVIALAKCPQKIKSLSRRVASRSIDYLETTMVNRYEQIYKAVIG